jgi:hypothetical protein
MRTQARRADLIVATAAVAALIAVLMGALWLAVRVVPVQPCETCRLERAPDGGVP